MQAALEAECRRLEADSADSKKSAAVRAALEAECKQWRAKHDALEACRWTSCLGLYPTSFFSVLDLMLGCNNSPYSICSPIAAHMPKLLQVTCLSGAQGSYRLHSRCFSYTWNTVRMEFEQTYAGLKLNLCSTGPKLFATCCSGTVSCRAQPGRIR